jgi:hypothetical protein
MPFCDKAITVLCFYQQDAGYDEKDFVNKFSKDKEFSPKI